LDHRVGWVERSETQHFVFVGFRSSTQPTFHALDETMIKARNLFKVTAQIIFNRTNIQHILRIKFFSNAEVGQINKMPGPTPSELFW
jgi:hypothetical protein